MPSEADIEDLLPTDAYIAAFNRVYVKELKGLALKTSELGAQPRIVERINHWLKEKDILLFKDGGFNHYRVAQAVLPALKASSLSPEELGRFERVFIKLNGVL